MGSGASPGARCPRFLPRRDLDVMTLAEERIPPPLAPRRPRRPMLLAGPAAVWSQLPRGSRAAVQAASFLKLQGLCLPCTGDTTTLALLQPLLPRGPGGPGLCGFTVPFTLPPA